MSARVGFQDMRFVIVSIRIQAQTGGNLSEVLSGLARLIRERHRLHLRVMSLSAEGRLSVKILGALPFCFFALVSIMSPRYYADIRENVTLQHVLEGGFVMLMIGIYLMRRVVNFRV
jgi:tight adherence protein B